MREPNVLVGNRNERPNKELGPNVLRAPEVLLAHQPLLHEHAEVERELRPDVYVVDLRDGDKRDVALVPIRNDNAIAGKANSCKDSPREVVLHPSPLRPLVVVRHLKRDEHDSPAVALRRANPCVHGHVLGNQADRLAHERNGLERNQLEASRDDVVHRDEHGPNILYVGRVSGIISYMF